VCSIYGLEEKEIKIRSYLYRLPSAVNVMLNLSIINLPIGRYVQKNNAREGGDSRIVSALYICQKETNTSENIESVIISPFSFK